MTKKKVEAEEAEVGAEEVEADGVEAEEEESKARTMLARHEPCSAKQLSARPRAFAPRASAPAPRAFAVYASASARQTTWESIKCFEPKDMDHLMSKLAEIENGLTSTPSRLINPYFLGLFRCPGQPGKHTCKVRILNVSKELTGLKKMSFEYEYLCVWQDGSVDRICRNKKKNFIQHLAM